MFANDETSRKFEGSFRLKLANMEDEHGFTDVEWQVNLGPGQKELRCLHIKEPFEKVSVNFTS